MRSSGRNSAPPRGLSAEARKLWKDILREYSITDPAGLSILRAGLESFDRASTAKRLLDVEGAVVRDRWGQSKVHPAAGVDRDSRAAWLSALKQLNLDLEPLRDGPGRPGGGAY